MRFLDYLIMPLADMVVDSSLRNYNVVRRAAGRVLMFARYFVDNIRDDRRFERKMEVDRKDSEIELRWMRICNRWHTNEEVEAANLANRDVRLDEL